MAARLQGKQPLHRQAPTWRGERLTARRSERRGAHRRRNSVESSDSGQPSFKESTKTACGTQGGMAHLLLGRDFA